MPSEKTFEKLVDRRDLLRAAAVAGVAPFSQSVSRATEQSFDSAIEGYVFPLSYQAGEKVRFYVSTTAPRYSIEIAREGASREIMWSKEALAGKQHPIPTDSSLSGCRWPVAWELSVPASWKSGYYQVKLRAENASGSTDECDTFFVVRSALPGRKSKILLQLTTNTYNAYNNFGGYSLYQSGSLPLEGVRVSFERPMARGHLTKPTGKLSRWHPYAGWFNWERPFVAWAEKAGYEIDYAVNSDLEFHPEILEGYQLVLSVGHDEYWSSPMRDHLESYIAKGGNVAFFSGNTCYWQVRSEDDGRAIVCYKFDFEKDPYFKNGNHKLLSGLWSHHLIGRPENNLTGVSFNYGGYHRLGSSLPRGGGGYTIHRADHWVFDGTKLAWGDYLGAKERIVGYECDGCEFILKHQMPIPTYRDGTPRGFTILASSPAQNWEDGAKMSAMSMFGEDASEEDCERIRRGAAVLGIYTCGGTVFTTGCTDWSRGLEAHNPLVERITRNVLDKLSDKA